MATVAHNLSKLLPKGLRTWARPKWHLLQDLFDFIFRKGGRLKYDPTLMCLVASRPVGGPRPMTVAVRSVKELRRFIRFGDLEDDVVYHWLKRLTAADVLYDIGASNALESFFTNCLHDNKVVMVEPFTPSIETILKSIYVCGRMGLDTSKFEVVQAACDAEEGFGQLLMHRPPVPGQQENSFDDATDYVTGELTEGGRAGLPVTVRQWMTSVTLDSLHRKHGLPTPTYVKIDVDGFEARVITGASDLIASRAVKSWAIEINGAPNDEFIGEKLSAAGYVEVGRYTHKKPAPYPCDCIYDRDDRADT